MNEPPFVYVYMCVRVCNVYACACVLVAHMKTVMCGGTNSHTCVTCRGHRRIWPFSSLTATVWGENNYIIIRSSSCIMCVVREPDGKSSECSDCAAAAAGSVLLEAGALFFKTKHFFLSFWRAVQMASRTRTTFLQCSVASPLSLMAFEA